MSDKNPVREKNLKAFREWRETFQKRFPNWKTMTLEQREDALAEVYNKSEAK